MSKYKYPKSIMIGSQRFKIKYDDDKVGASFIYPEGGEPGIITFGMADHEKGSFTFLENIIHEISEILHLEASTRFYNAGNDGYEFHYNHQQFTDHCARLAGLLRHFIG